MFSFRFCVWNFWVKSICNFIWIICKKLNKYFWFHFGFECTVVCICMSHSILFMKKKLFFFSLIIFPFTHISYLRSFLFVMLSDIFSDIHTHNCMCIVVRTTTLIEKPTIPLPIRYWRVIFSIWEGKINRKSYPINSEKTKNWKESVPQRWTGAYAIHIIIAVLLTMI